MEPILRLEKAGDKLVGALTDNQGRATPVKDAQLKDGELSFRTIMKRDGQEFTFLYKGKLSRDAIKGQVTANLLGRELSFDFEGKRKKEEATLSGSWKITLVLESGQELRPSLRLKQEGDQIHGDYTGTSGKESRLQDVKFKDGEFSFRAPEQFEENKVSLSYQGKVLGDTMQGTAKFGIEPQLTILNFKGERIKTPTANLGGTWKLKVPFKDGFTFEPTLKLVQLGSGLNGSYLGEQGDTAIADALILGDEFTFEVGRDRDGKHFKLRYQGSVQGDTLKGSVDYDFDGMTGSLHFEGKRVGKPSTTLEKKP
jgi:hypothetical protein